MITNILATVLISVVTNWVDIYEQVDTWNIPYYVKNGANVDISFTFPWKGLQENRYMNGKYLGKDGTVVKVTEISFDYLGERQVHRIEKHIRMITMRGHEAPPVEPEFIWDAPVIEPIYENIDSEITDQNAFITNVISVTTNMAIWKDCELDLSTIVTIGPVSICTTNGIVTIEDGVTMDEASRKFWQGLEGEWK